MKPNIFVTIGEMIGNFVADYLKKNTLTWKIPGIFHSGKAVETVSIFLSDDVVEKPAKKTTARRNGTSRRMKGDTLETLAFIFVYFKHKRVVGKRKTFLLGRLNKETA